MNIFSGQSPKEIQMGGVKLSFKTELQAKAQVQHKQKLKDKIDLKVTTQQQKSQQPNGKMGKRPE